MFRPCMLLPPRWQVIREKRLKGEAIEPLLPPTRSDDEESSENSFDDLSLGPPFNFNPLHDLESCWWMGTFGMLDWANNPVPQDISTPEKDRVAKQHALAYKLFDTNNGRKDTMLTAGTFASELRCLQGAPRRAGEALEKWRVQLVERYIKSEKDRDALLHVDFAGLHDSFIETMDTIIDLVNTTRPDPQVPPPTSKKRTRETDEVDDFVKKPRVA